MRTVTSNKIKFMFVPLERDDQTSCSSCLVCSTCKQGGITSWLCRCVLVPQGGSQSEAANGLCHGPLLFLEIISLSLVAGYVSYITGGFWYVTGLETLNCRVSAISIQFFLWGTSLSHISACPSVLEAVFSSPWYTNGQCFALFWGLWCRLYVKLVQTPESLVRGQQHLLTRNWLVSYCSLDVESKKPIRLLWK